MNTQTHILYRNRAEHDFWEGGYFVPLVGGLSAGLVVFLLLVWLIDKMKFISHNAGAWNLAMGSSAVAAIATGFFVATKLMI